VKEDSGLYPFRRHLTTCEYFGPGGREARADKCNCPFHVDGNHRGQRVRQSLRTRSRQLADRRLADLVRMLDAKLDEQEAADTAYNSAPGPSQAQPTLSVAVKRFLKRGGEIDEHGKFRGDLQYATWRKYRCGLAFLESFCQEQGISALADVTLEVLEDFRPTRRIGQVAWKVELQTLRTFFAYCISHKWITVNPAKEMKSPRNIKPNEVVPYTLTEESKILAACEGFGGGRSPNGGVRYERLRARAMVLVLRHTALRVSDVCTLRKDAISWDENKKTWRVLLRTQKTGDPVHLPIPENVKLVLDAVPLPRNAPQDCPYYFWNGQTSRRAVVGIAERTLGTVFKKSGVKNARAHRFRHTLATRLLGDGATHNEVADILGNTEGVVRKHYGKWSQGRQDNIDRLMLAHFGTAVTNPVTKKSHEKTGAVN
jgi:integrase